MSESTFGAAVDTVAETNSLTPVFDSRGAEIIPATESGLQDQDQEQNHGSTEEAGKSVPLGLAETLDFVHSALGWTGTLYHSADKSAPPYLGWGTQHALTVATLWAAHANARVVCKDTDHKHGPGVAGQMVWPATPRLGLFAPEEGSGKTYLAERILDFVPYPSLQDEPTGPGLLRKMGLQHSTVAIDEGDIFLGNDSRKRTAISIMNNGYRPGGESSHAEGSRDTFDVSTFGPIMVAAIDTIESGTGGRLKALLSRFIVIRLKKAPDGYRPLRLRRVHKENIQKISECLLGQMMRVAPQLGEMEAEMPAYFSPRAAEIWEPLFLTAVLADSTDPRDSNLHSHWTRRIVAAADWFCNGGEQRAVLESGLTKMRSMSALWAEEMAR